MEYITGKQAQLILNITTRQGLHKVSKEHNIKIKSQGAGKPNLYLKSDVEEVAARTNKKRIKQNPELKKKVKKKQEIIETKKQEVATTQAKGMLNNNPLNEVGQEVFNELKNELVENETYEEKDVSLLQAYCVSYQKYINAINQSAEHLDTTMDDIGSLKIHPYFQIADKCLSQMIKIANVLGIGAKSRMQLNIKAKKKESVFDILKSKEDF